ncbi:MAG: sulfotransferase family protein [Desulfobacterales bacterium]
MAETGNERRLIFVGGSPRSGTTLVQNMLDSHPLILGGPEFLYLTNIVELRGKVHFSISQGWIDIFFTKDDVDRHIVSLIERLFLPLADKNQCEFYSEKTPMNILVFSELIELFPEAHFIHIIRDPRAIVASMKQVKERAVDKGLKPPPFTENLATSIEYVKKCFNAGFTAIQNAPGKVLTIVYEQLLTNPEKETKRICKYLGIEWNDLMLYPGDKEHLGEQAITTNSNEIWYDSKTYNRNPDNRNIEKWQSKLTLGQQIRTIIAFKNNRDLLQYGYNLSLDSLTQANDILARIYYIYLRLCNTIYKFSSYVVRKIPGISLVKKGLSVIVRFLE